MANMIKLRVHVDKSGILADFGCMGSIIMGYIPVFLGFNSTIINAIKLTMGIIFLLGVMARDVHMFKSMVFILALEVAFSVLYYYRVWYIHTSLLFFLNRSTLCWLYALFGVYYLKYGNVNTVRNFARLIYLIVIITCITTMISMQLFPEASRVLGNSNSYSDEEIQYLYIRNTASWGMAYSMVFILPVWIDRFKKTKSIWYLIGAIVITICELRMQITFAIIFTIGFWIFMFKKPMKMRTMIIIILCIAVMGMVLQEYIGDILLGIYQLLGSTKLEVLKRRIYQLYVTFAYGQFYGDASARMGLYGMSLTTFLKHPFFGVYMTEVDTYRTIGLHSQILDTLAATGIVGIALCGLCFIYIARYISRGIHDQISKNYYLLAVLTLVVLMLVNPIWSAAEPFLTVFLLPVLYYRINAEQRALNHNRIGVHRLQ